MNKIVVSDIDGTLVHDGGGPEAINHQYFQEVIRLNSEGIQVVLASGRQYASMRRMFKPVEEHLLFISEGGTMVFEQGQVIYSTPLNKVMVKEIIEDIEQIPNCDAMVCGRKKVYVRDENSKLYRWMKDCYRYDIEAVGDSITSIDDEIVKVSLFSRNDCAEQDVEKWFTPKWKKRLKVSVAGIQWVDLVAEEAGKGSAVSFIQKKLGVSKENTIVFGDNFNDIDMFLQAGTSFAVKNAREEVRAHATNLCEGYETDGVLKEWRKIHG